MADCIECGVAETYAKGTCRRCYRRHQMHRLRRERAAREGREIRPVGLSESERFARMKRCPRCGEEKPAASGFYRTTVNGRPYPSAHCRDCSKRQLAEFGKGWKHTEEGRRDRSERKRRRLHELAPPGKDSYAYSAILRRDPCAYCCGPAGEIDHIVPVSMGGDGEWDNLTAACRRCNNDKKAKPLLVFMAERG